MLPSVDAVLRLAPLAPLIAHHGRTAVRDAVRRALAAARDGGTGLAAPDWPAACEAELGRMFAPSLRRVFNLTGTILHTNLGRATLPEEAIAALVAAASDPCNLEYDLGEGERGQRDSHVARVLTELVGAPAATVVNNNAAAVLLALNALAQGREVVISRGELVEIGGSFRIPDLVRRAGCRLVEVGTTNRTHPHDYAEALSPRTAMILKVHTSNYAIQGFTAAVGTRALAGIARAAGVPLMVDLGSGTLARLADHGLPPEPMPQEALAEGADLVAFSGDKVLGGPQAGLVVGDAALIARMDRNPLKRALRVDKLRIAALEAVLLLYRSPERLAERLPVLWLMTRPLAAIEAQAHRVVPPLQAALGEDWAVGVEACGSQVGSGALPDQLLASMAVAVAPRAARRSTRGATRALEAAFRRLPVPVVGRLSKDRLLLDLRCLSDEAGFVGQLADLPRIDMSNCIRNG